MNKDPYEILGISRDASKSEVKKAYHELAKKYHPDNFTDPQMAKLADEKMKEINEAYDYVSRNSYDSGPSYSYSSAFSEIRVMINNGNFSEAELRLDSMIDSDKNAEWFFLKGCILTHRGWFMDAQRFFDEACRLDPQNPEYHQAKESLRNTATSYSRGYRESPPYSRSGGCCEMDLCTSIVCANCLCNCLECGCN